jgi:hypothetical protein
VKFWGWHIFLPRPVASAKRPWRKNHMPKAAIEKLVAHMRITARILWALHSTLREGFTRDMVLVLRDTYPAGMIFTKKCER